MANTPYYSKAEADQKNKETFREVERTVESISAGEGGKSFATLADAQAVSPIPPNGTVFQVEEEANSGYHKYDSTQAGGTKFLKEFINVSKKTDFSDTDFFESFEKNDAGSVTDVTDGSGIVLYSIFSAFKHVRLQGVDITKKHRLRYIRRLSSRWSIDIDQWDGASWVRIYYADITSGYLENTNGVTEWDFCGNVVGSNIRLYAQIEWDKIPNESAGSLYSTNNTSYIFKNEVLNEKLITDSTLQEAPISKRYGKEMFPCFTRFLDGNIDEIVNTVDSEGRKFQVYSAFRKLEIFGSNPELPHKIYFMRRNFSNTWRFIIHRKELGSWIKVIDANITGYNENVNGTTPFRYSADGVTVKADINWSYLNEGSYSMEGIAADPLFIIRPECVFEKLNTGVFYQKSTSITYDAEQVSKIFKNIELYNADENLLYSIRFFTRNNATHGSRIIITSSNDDGATWSDYIDFNYNIGESVNGNLITVDKLVSNYKGVKLILDTKYIFKDLYAPTNGEIVLNPKFITNYAGAKDLGVWINEFPYALSKVNTFRQKLLSRNDDLYISLYGDSLTAQHNKTPVLESENRPPQLTNKNWMYFFWQLINDIEVVADRYDSTVNAFTEVGAGWIDSWEFFDNGSMSNPRYDERKENGGLTRYTNDSNASVAFDWNLDAYDKAHFIYRRDIRGTSTATIAVSGGNGKIEVWNGASWVEANGFLIDMKLAGTQGEGETLGNWRLKMRKSATGSLNQTITVSKGANTDYLFYWGVERWNGNAIFLTNIARGGLNTVEWSYNVQGELSRLTDFVICQLPLINEYGNFRTNTQTIIDNQQDFIWGDRVGSLNANSLKSLSNDWTDFQVLAVIPNHRKEYLNGDKYKLDYLNDGADAPPNLVWNRVKALVDLKGELDYIPVDSVWDAEAKKRDLTREESYSGSNAKDITAFTMDTVHQNDLGSEIYAKYLAPIFKL